MKRQQQKRGRRVPPVIVPAGRRPFHFAMEAGISRPTLDRLPVHLRPFSVKLGTAQSSPRIITEEPRDWLARVAAIQQANAAAR